MYVLLEFLDLTMEYMLGGYNNTIPSWGVSDKENRTGKCKVELFPCLFHLQFLYMDWTPPPPFSQPLFGSYKSNMKTLLFQELTSGHSRVWLLFGKANYRSQSAALPAPDRKTWKSLVRGDPFSLHIWGPGYGLQKTALSGCSWVQAVAWPARGWGELSRQSVRLKSQAQYWGGFEAPAWHGIFLPESASDAECRLSYGVCADPPPPPPLPHV